ncbi:hypothetical protein ANCDUO_27575 [Ancylostoma duodenale]|uniref:SnoaL-like domain-containing protein n=1 Tax=Ancylostoma duodenale TaxID=51022 RepID=A0A0C2F1R3_9BILA|nr:hypothetical protein ANCDUO_27575 [Ancylostoma duodenale]
MSNYFRHIPLANSLLNAVNNSLFQEIKNRQQAFMKAFNAGDPKGAAAVYDPDGYFMPNGRHPVKGRAGIEEYFKEDMADGVQTAQVLNGFVVPWLI